MIRSSLSIYLSMYLENVSRPREARPKIMVHIYTYVHIYIYIYVYINKYIYIYTYIHILYTAVPPKKGNIIDI